MENEQMMQFFFEIHSGLPREGPGSTPSTRKAFAMLGKLPEKPYVLDIGCGPGMQTLDLLALTDGEIVALDNHQPFLDDLILRATRKGVSARLATVNADMSNLGFFKEGIFDVIWAEGSAFIIGFEKALRQWKPLLKRPGYLAVSEMVWLKPHPPKEVREFFAAAAQQLELSASYSDPPEESPDYFTAEYPWVHGIGGNAEIIRRAGYTLIGHFTLPESDWWDGYYMPIEKKLTALREKYKGNPEALAVIELEEREIEIYRKYSAYYGYEFFVMQA